MENLADLTPAELTRYSRQLMLPDFGPAGQTALKAAKVVVVGMGGLGCPVATYLAAAGVGSLLLVDHDTVEPTNLHRQVLYGPSDVGRLKVEVAAERLRHFDSNLEILTAAHQVSSGDPWWEEALTDASVIVDGSDNFPTRYGVNEAAVARRIPLIYGSVYRYTGEVSAFLVEDGPCYACLHPTAPPEGTTPNCAEGGVLGVLPGLVGMLQAGEALKVLARFGKPASGRLVSVDVRRAPMFREWKFARRADCHVCGNGVAPAPPTSREALAPAPEVSLDQFRQKLQDEGFLLVDIRSAGERSFGALRDSVPRHGEDLDLFLNQGPRSVVFACKSGGRSRALVSRLRTQGWDQAFSLAGSWAEWSRKPGESGMVSY